MIQDRIGLKLLILLPYIFISACGYTFAGRGQNLPPDIKTVAVTVLKNKTSELGIENILTNRLVYEFTRSRRLLIESQDAADVTLGGSVDSLKEETVSRSGSYRSLERRITITLSLSLKDRNEKTIWSDTGISDHEVFKVSEDRLSTQKNRRESIEKIASRLAEKVQNRIFEGF